MYKLVIMIFALLLISNIGFAEGKIGSDLEKKLSSLNRKEEFIPVVVLFEGVPSFKEVAKEYRFLGNDEVVKEQVIQVMKDNAHSLHFWLKQMCESRIASKVKGFKSIWIANAVKLEATPSAINEIKDQPNVEKILLNEPVNMLLEDDMTWGLKKIDAPGAWEYYKGKNVTVAVIDTGVNEHGDLKGRIRDGKNYITPGTPPRDDNKHGTHCAGTIAGDGAMGTKTGVAPEAKIWAVKVLSGNGGGEWPNLWLAMEECLKKVDVLSMSLGGRASDEYKKRLQQACDTVIQAGVIPVIAAGNSGPRPKTVGSPGDVFDVITVGATDSKDKAAYFSSRGPVEWFGKEYIKPDVSAPGVGVVSCNYKDSSGYISLSGTSMATPHVAGLVALMKQANKKLNTEQAKKILEMTALDLGEPGKDNTYGAGRVQALKSVEAAKNLNQKRERWETVVKKLEVKAKIDGNGNVQSKPTNIDNDLMPATVTIWCTIKETAGQKGKYHINFCLTGPTNKSGEVIADFDHLPQNNNQYDPKYGFNCGKFRLEKGLYKGEIKSKSPNPKVKDLDVTFEGCATWPARD